MGVNVCAQAVLYDLVKDMVEWHDATELPEDTLCKIIEPLYGNHYIAYHKKGDGNRWETGDAGITTGVKRWAVCPKEYWLRYCNGEFSTNKAWCEYVERMKSRKEKSA